MTFSPAAATLSLAFRSHIQVTSANIHSYPPPLYRIHAYAPHTATHCCVAVCCSVLQCVAACCNIAFMHMPLPPQATTYHKHLDHIYNLHTQTFIRAIDITHVYDYVLLLLTLHYALASVSRIDKTIGVFCKRALYKRQHSAKETYNFFVPTDCRHPISVISLTCISYFTHMYDSFSCSNQGGFSQAFIRTILLYDYVRVWLFTHLHQYHSFHSYIYHIHVSLIFLQ